MSRFLDKAEKLMACHYRKELQESLKRACKNDTLQHHSLKYDDLALVDEDYSDDEYNLLK